MTATHPMTTVSFTFVVVMIASISVVSGRLDLRAFGEHDVPYAFGCRRGRCGSPPMRPLSGGRDQPDDVSEVGAKLFDADDYDDDNRDEDVKLFLRALESQRLTMTFPYCSRLSAEECRSLLGDLERLRLRRLQRRVVKRNVTVSGDDGTVVRLLGRRRRSARKRDTDTVRPAESDHEDETAYQQKRRNIRSVKDLFVIPNKRTEKDVDVDRRRGRRSVVVEIESDEELPDSERDMLDTYLAWRETHGYGTLSGRWG